MTTTLSYTDVLTVKECPVCSISYAVPKRFDQRKSEQGGDWYCPAGHCLHYARTEIDKLREKAAREEQWRKDADTRRRAAEDQASAAERRVTAYKGHATRMKKRASAGICPCCTRTFQNVQRHMASQHPAYAASDA